MQNTVYLLALLGGYVFVIKCHRFRFQSNRSRGHHLFFTSAFAAIWLLIISFPMNALLGELFQWWQTFTRSFNSFHPHLGESLLAFLLGSFTWPLANRFVDEKAEARRAIEFKKDPLEVFFSEALEDASLVSVATKSNKVYVGFVTSEFNPAFELNSISILPFVSGHRSRDTQSLELTVDYYETYSKLFEAGRLRDSFGLFRKEETTMQADSTAKPTIDLGDFKVYLPFSEVRSANRFMSDVYDEMFKSRSQNTPQPDGSQGKGSI